jgi:hypothetical protein
MNSWREKRACRIVREEIVMNTLSNECEMACHLLPRIHCGMEGFGGKMLSFVISPDIPLGRVTRWWPRVSGYQQNCLACPLATGQREPVDRGRWVYHRCALCDQH